MTSSFAADCIVYSVKWESVATETIINMCKILRNNSLFELDSTLCQFDLWNEISTVLIWPAGFPCADTIITIMTSSATAQCN